MATGHPNRLAAIDVGSNSVLLLVADISGNTISAPVREEIAITGLGERLNENRVLPAEAVEETVRLMSHYLEAAREAGSRQVLAVATAAVREAINGQELADLVMARLGLPLHAISAQEEARLTLRGVHSHPSLTGRDLVVVDIGGGSTEIAAGGPDGVSDCISLPFGCVRLRHIAGDATSAADFDRLCQQASSLTQPHLVGIDPSSLQGRLIGVGGTITTLAAIDLALDPSQQQRADGHELTLTRVERLSRHLADLPPQHRQNVAGLPRGREDTILPGAALLLNCMVWMQKRHLRVSTRGLRYGVLVEAAREHDSRC